MDMAELRKTLSPIFVIGGNRSGTSLVSSILSQHPDLEGLFAGARETKFNAAGHAVGYCESRHIWPHLFPGEAKRRRGRHLPYWALPQYVGDAYRERTQNSEERDDLLWAVQRLRRTSHQPLIKDQFNILRVGLINDVFPRARFILVSRGWPDFIERGTHKWRHDGMNSVLDPNSPRAGLHWQLLNTIARYDLEAFVPGRYGEIWLDSLHESPEAAARSLADAADAVGLAPFEFDLNELISQPEGDVSGDLTDIRSGFDGVKRLVQFEREVLVRDGKAR